VRRCRVLPWGDSPAMAAKPLAWAESKFIGRKKFNMLIPQQCVPHDHIQAKPVCGRTHCKSPSPKKV
jgi:hypothetical protein